jgi:ribonuclease Z
MPAAFSPRTVNGPFGDPGLFVAFHFQRRALLFDLGENAALAPRDLLKVSHVFVSHTHMDHFIGFDRLLRVCLGREKELHLFGPAGFLRHVAGKLAGYAWDLVAEGPGRLVLHLTEILAGGARARTLVSRDGFRAAGPPERRPLEAGRVRAPGFSVAAEVLEHSGPCLGFRLQEDLHVNILKPGLAELGLSPGPWLTRFKRALAAGEDAAREFAVDGPGRRWPLGELARRIARITPGRTVAYVTDVADSPRNREAIVRLARGADLLFIEAAFLHRDRGLAAARHHLTARQAGEIAGLAGARRFRIFHFSPRYEGREALLLEEARAAYAETAVPAALRSNRSAAGVA